MKKIVLVVALTGWFCVGGIWQQSAYAGVGDVFKNLFTYATSPVNCVLNLGRNILSDGIYFVTCFLGNVNRNPATLNPVITGSIKVPTL